MFSGDFYRNEGAVPVVVIRLPLVPRWFRSRSSSVSSAGDLVCQPPSMERDLRRAMSWRIPVCHLKKMYQYGRRRRACHGRQLIDHMRELARDVASAGGAERGLCVVVKGCDRGVGAVRGDVVDGGADEGDAAAGVGGECGVEGGARVGSGRVEVVSGERGFGSVGQGE